MSENKEKLNKILPLVSTFFIFCGVYRLMLYYKAFNINIIYFIDITEVLVSILDILVYVALTGLIFTILYFSINRVDQDWRLGVLKKEVFLQEKRFVIRLKFYIKYFNLGFYSGFIFLILSGIKWLLGKPYEKSLEVSIYCFVLLFLLMIFLEFEKNINLILNKPIDFMYHSLLVIAIVFLFFLTFQVHKEISAIKNDKKYSNVTFTVDDKIVKSDKFNYFIGKTKDYLFFYQESENKTTVYPMRRIQEIQFPKTR